MDSTKVNDGAKITRAFLTGGIIAGPVYTILGLVQALTRPGFDITHHDLSLLSNGDLGWIQIANFLVTGLLVIAGAVGMRQVLRGSWGGTWVPLLIGVYGLALLAQGSSRLTRRMASRRERQPERLQPSAHLVYCTW